MDDSPSALGECVYCTRLIGSDPALVLHGGGNSSVKTTWTDITGRTVDAIHVKGSGWDMGTIEAAGFAPLRVDGCTSCSSSTTLSDTDMMRELDMARLDPSAPNPSVESLLHALLPHPAVQHSHADVIVTLTNLADGDGVVRSVFGDDVVVVVPYVMPGFDLARAVRERWPEESHPGTVGMVLLEPRAVHLRRRLAAGLPPPRRAHRPGRAVARPRGAPSADDRDAGQALPHGCAGRAGRAPPVDLARRSAAGSSCGATPTRACAALRRPAPTSRRSPPGDRSRPTTSSAPSGCRWSVATSTATPTSTARYVDEHRARAPAASSPTLDPAPRVVLDPELGMLTAGPHRQGRRHRGRHLRTTPSRCSSGPRTTSAATGPLPPGDLFDVEYWELEQAKLRAAGGRRRRRRDGRGRHRRRRRASVGPARPSCSARGAAVAGIDRDLRRREPLPGSGLARGHRRRHRRRRRPRRGGRTVERFGGVDLAVVSAGIFGRVARSPSCRPATGAR